jgi:hypothetical protein
MNIKYKGVNKDDIAQSLDEAVLYIIHTIVEENLDFDGPVCSELYKWTAKDGLIQDIKDAETSIDLAQALLDTNVKRVFSDFEALLIFRAKIDSSGKGLKVYQDLKRWGCFDTPRTVDITPIRDEVKSWLKRQSKQDKDIAEMTELPTFEYDLKTYGVAFFEKFDGKGATSLQWKTDAWDFAEEISDIIETFKNKGEFAGLRSAVLDKDRVFLGLKFETNAECLEAILKRFPDVKIVDDSGVEYISRAKTMQAKRDEANKKLIKKLKSVKGEAPKIKRRTSDRKK